MSTDGINRDRILPRELSTVLEGEFSTWVNRWTYRLPNTLVAIVNRDAHIDDIHELLYYIYRDQNVDHRLLILNCRTGAVVFLSPVLTDYVWTTSAAIGDVQYCNRQRYFSLMRLGNDIIEVWYNGAMLWTDLLSNYFVGTGAFFTVMSRSARWLLACGRERIWMFEGA